MNRLSESMTTIDLDAEVPLKGCSYPASYSTEAMRERRLAAYRAGLEAAAKTIDPYNSIFSRRLADDIRALKDRVYG